MYHELLTRVTTGHYATRTEAVEAVQLAKQRRIITDEHETILLFAIKMEHELNGKHNTMLP